MKSRHIFWIALLLGSCSAVRETRTITPQNVATSWADLTLYITKNTPANSPTYASRALGYIGLTMYESVVHSSAEHRSLAGQLNGLGLLPLPDNGAEYDWPVALNAAQASIVKAMYQQTSDANKQRIDSLEAALHEYLSTGKNPQVTMRSVNFGRAVAETIATWARSDGGDRAYLRNFDKTFVRTPSPGSWEPPLYGQSFSHFPLHPHWGDNRPLVPANASMDVPPLPVYDTSRSSAYYKEFLAVYEKSKTLTMQEKEAALWWGDDPGETFTPPGHSYYLATQVIGKAKPALIVCAETYARVGIAVADAFTNCWKWKYHHYSERPSSFIVKNIDPRWESFWPDPPFPAFPSGHATQAGAVAAVMTALFAENFDIADDSHAGRPADELRGVGFKSRTFSSFWQIAEETANSRFYGGIHTRFDNETGLSEGKKIGNHVNQLSWRKTDEYAVTGN